MSAKNTQGPWATDDASPGDLFRYVLHGAGDSFGYVCRVSTNGNANAEADARLIAAAPELLEALERLSAQCARLRLPGQTESDAEKTARAAIARATGQQS